MCSCQPEIALSALATATDGGTVAFVGFNAQAAPRGVFIGSGAALTTVADHDTSVPDGSGALFDQFSSVNARQGSVAFTAFSGPVEGVFVSSGSALEKIADTGALQPGAAGAFSSFGPLSVDATGVAFVANGSQNGDGGATGSFTAGVYVVQAGSTQTIADTGTPIPDGTGTFTQFRTRTTAQGPALDGGAVVFSASGPDGQEGIYSTFGGGLHTVIDLDDMLDGKTLDSVATGVNAFDAGQIAFWVRFDDGSEGIFLATPVPEPGAWAAMAAGLLLLACAVRWRTR